MKSSQKKFGLRLFVLALFAIGIYGGVYLVGKAFQYQKEPVPEAIDIAEVQIKTQQIEPKNGNAKSSQKSQETQELQESQETTSEIPLELNLKVPFYAQAPFGNWDYPWQEACEEASVLLVANTYFKRNWTKEEFNDQILQLVEWEKKEFGDYKHTDVKQTVDLLDRYLNLKTVIHENPTFEKVKKILAKGHLVVMTFAGKRLGNPNYKNGGPVYHAMVIKGYKDGEKIITNDVGTRKGEDYVYSWSTIENALHDYSEPIESGPKRMIEVLPPPL